MSFEELEELHQQTAAILTLAQTVEYHLADTDPSPEHARENVMYRFERHGGDPENL